jgi:hypothetical protein
MITFFEEKNKSGYASIYETNITLSSNMLNYLKECYRIRCGIDSDENKIYLFPLNKDQSLSNEYNIDSLLKPSFSKTYAKISSSTLIRFIKEQLKFEISPNKYIKFKCVYDDNKKVIIIDTKEGEKC